MLSLSLCFRAEERKYRRFPSDMLFKQESDEEGMGCLFVSFAQWIGSFLLFCGGGALVIGDTAIFYNDIPLH